MVRVMSFTFDNDRPIYLQIIEHLKKLIACGQYKPSQKLPSIRELAESMGVNPNTVQKALFELEDIGLILTERTNGKFVTSNLQLIEDVKNNLLNQRAQKFFSDMEEIGLDYKQAIEYLINRRGEK